MGLQHWNIVALYHCRTGIPQSLNPTIPQYHNYDRFPEIAVTTEQTAVSGAAAIAQVLKEQITGDCVLVFDCYPGVEARTLSPIFALLAPNAVFDAEECMLDKDTYANRIQPYLTDDRVFGYLCKDNWSDYFDMQKIAAMQERIRNGFVDNQIEIPVPKMGFVDRPAAAAVQSSPRTV